MEKPPNSIMVFSLIVIVIVATLGVSSFVDQGPATVTMTGSAFTIPGTGTPTAIVFIEQLRVNGPGPFYTSKLTDGNNYSISLPNHESYVVLIDFEKGYGFITGSCTDVSTLVNSWWGNTTVTRNWAC